ncbi:MAG: HEPN domain-containing protein [Ignavibacteriae bacterium]|nr:MAG: HEPN domain-containing protein [Ignavibacteriota bacterium]
MEDEIKGLSQYRLEKAKLDLEAAKLNYENNLYSQSINRSCYAVFHAVRALLSYERFDSKKHSGIISYFNLNYINAGKIDKKFSKILMSAEKIRINTDYLDFYIVSKEDTKKQIENAEEFIIEIENFIKSNYK